MKDIRIVHDTVGSYADWEREQGDPCESMKMHRYLLGANKPNYPVPAIQYDAGIGNNGVEVIQVKGDWSDMDNPLNNISVWFHLYE